MRITLNGYVVADDDAWIYRLFGYSVFSPADVRKALRNNPDGEELTFEINSGGGSVFAGFEMYSVLASSPVKTVAEVQSIAASAASVLILGCDRVLLSPVAQVMAHLPSTVTEGDVPAHKDSIKVLESIKQSILNAYETRCKGRRTRDQLEKMMNASSWMYAQEALDAGLADAIIGQEGDDGVLPGQIVNAVGAGIRAVAGSNVGLPDAEALRAEYRGLIKDGKAPAPGPEPREPEETHTPADEASAENTDGWRAQARLNIEKERFI